MQQLKSYSDQRLLTGCLYCAEPPNTREHVPSRALLDEPYPENLPVVDACRTCNESFSLDEEYFACLVECARCGSQELVQRPKVKRILGENTGLKKRIDAARKISNDGLVSYECELDRIRGVVVKLAQGHAAFELGVQMNSSPAHIMAVPLRFLGADGRNHFEMVPSSEAWPEVGSRAMQRMLVVATDSSVHSLGWVDVQSDQYRYFAVAESNALMVRIVIGEYLACEVIWREADF